MQHPIVLIALTLFATSALANADSWSCRNNDLEIQCDQENQCSVSESFTPVAINIDKSSMSICAYSGCWEGAVKITQLSKHNHVFFGKDLQWTGSKENRAEFVVVIDTQERLGIIKGGSFAMPVACTEKKK